MYVYIQSEPQLWTVGFYRPADSKWMPESDHGTPGEAAQRASELNGIGSQAPAPTEPPASAPRLTVVIPLTDSMRTPEDLAGALRQAASKIQSGTGNGKIRDKWGDFAGEFDITSGAR
jgi:hypothetical protein